MQSGFLYRLTTGENLVLISQSTFEKFKIHRFVFSICLQLGKKSVFSYMRGFKPCTKFQLTMYSAARVNLLFEKSNFSESTIPKKKKPSS